MFLYSSLLSSTALWNLAALASLKAQLRSHGLHSGSPTGAPAWKLSLRGKKGPSQGSSNLFPCSSITVLGCLMVSDLTIASYVLSLYFPRGRMNWSPLFYLGWKQMSPQYALDRNSIFSNSVPESQLSNHMIEFLSVGVLEIFLFG